MLREYSPDTPSGSLTKDLVRSKLWLCTKLQNLGLDKFSSVYILGSWYGTMGLFLLHKRIEFDRAYNIDWDFEKTRYVDHLLKRLKLRDRISAIQMDANDIDYKGEPILVINTSTNDMEGLDWLNNIPRGSVVALQGRDHQGDSNGVETLDRFDRVYKLRETLYLGSIVVEDYEGYPYLRFMKIGIK